MWPKYVSVKVCSVSVSQSRRLVVNKKKVNIKGDEGGMRKVNLRPHNQTGQ